MCDTHRELPILKPHPVGCLCIDFKRHLTYQAFFQARVEKLVTNGLLCLTLEKTESVVCKMSAATTSGKRQNISQLISPSMIIFTGSTVLSKTVVQVPALKFNAH